jgi:hypothetical protein
VNNTNNDDVDNEPARTRDEHMKWCKQRAHEALNFGGYADAVASMMSDLRKHPETARSAEIAGMLMLTVRDRASAIKFIDGFN